MDKLTNSYPVYAPDQVLTNKSLNNSVGYLDIQGRFTRSGMIGHGIVCGLNYTVQNISGPTSVDPLIGVTITTGYGSSIEGLILQLFEIGAQGLNFRYVKKYVRPADVVSNLQLANPDSIEQAIPVKKITANTKLAKRTFGRGNLNPIDPLPDVWSDAYELVPIEEEKTTKDLIPISQLLSGSREQILFLYVEILDIKSENCSPEDCDEKGKLRRLRIVPLIADASFFNPQNYAGAKKDIVQLKRMMDFEHQYSANDLYNSFAKINQLNLKVLIPTLVDIANSFANANYLNTSAIFELDIIKFLESEIAQKSFLNGNRLVQYGYDFLLDVELAVNEYIQHINCRPANTCNFGANRQERMLVLGKLNDINIYTDQYRYRFVEAPSVQEDNEYKMIAYKLYQRIWKLIPAYEAWINNMLFSDNVIASEERIIISPSRSAPSLLGSRALPYYYNVVGDKGTGFSIDYLLEYWCAHTCNNRSLLDIYGYNLFRIDRADPKTDFNNLVLDNTINEYNFFRIEGHIGKKVDDAEGYVNGLINNKNLPFRTFRLQLKSIVKGELGAQVINTKLTAAAAKLRKAAAIDIAASRVLAADTQPAPQIALANIDSYFQTFTGLGLDGATFIAGAGNTGNYTVEQFRINTQPITTNPKILTLQDDFANNQRTVALKVVGTDFAGGANQVFAGEIYTLQVIYGRDYVYYSPLAAEVTKATAAVDITKITEATTPPKDIKVDPTLAIPNITGRIATAETPLADLAANISAGFIGGAAAAIVTPRYTSFPPVTVIAQQGDDVNSIAAKLVDALTKLRTSFSTSLPRLSTVVASVSNRADTIYIVLNNPPIQSFAYSITAGAQAVDSNVTQYLNIEFIGGGNLLSPVELTVCYKSPKAEFKIESKVRMLTGTKLVGFPKDLKAYLVDPESYYLCGIKPLVIDDGGGGPIDGEYNTWPFDAQGNLLFNIFKGAEHLAGVYRGGTFIFLTELQEDKTEIVVGDISLPWDLEFVKLSRAIALKFNRKYWRWGNQWDVLPTLDMGIK
jgi:hypothetical protein